MYSIQQLEGRDHFVVPVVMMVEGVLNGSHGAFYYPPDEIQAAVPQWNGKPVVVYHPDIFGASVSAGNPEVLNRQKIGTVFNTSWDGKRLKAEAWIDVDRVQTVDKRVHEAILNRKMMEVSTGLYTHNEPASPWMTFNGKPYTHIAQYHRPDHLAILPDQVGACSISDGAGLCRNGEARSFVSMFKPGKGPDVKVYHDVYVTANAAPVPMFHENAFIPPDDAQSPLLPPVWDFAPVANERTNRKSSNQIGHRENVSNDDANSPLVLPSWDWS